MKTLQQLHEAFGNVARDEEGNVTGVANPELRYFAVLLPEGENPFTDLSNYATADLQVASLDDGVYAASVGDFTGDVTIEITE